MVEAYFIEHYGYDASAIFQMSWRKFCLLFDASFVTDRDEAKAGPTQADQFGINELFDQAQGKPKSDAITKMGLNEFVGKM